MRFVVLWTVTELVTCVPLAILLDITPVIVMVRWCPTGSADFHRHVTSCAWVWQRPSMIEYVTFVSTADVVKSIDRPAAFDGPLSATPMMYVIGSPGTASASFARLTVRS